MSGLSTSRPPPLDELDRLLDESSEPKYASANAKSSSASSSGDIGDIGESRDESRGETITSNCNSFPG